VIATSGDGDYMSENESTSFASHGLVFDPLRGDGNDCLDDYPTNDLSRTDYVDGRFQGLALMNDTPDCDHAMIEGPLFERRFSVYEAYWRFR